MKNREWIYCPICGNKTRIKILEDTEIKKLPLFCPKCKKETIIDVQKYVVTIIKEPDAQTQSRKFNSESWWICGLFFLDIGRRLWWILVIPWKRLTCRFQKKPCSRTGSAGLLLCTIQCSFCAFHAAIMPGWPFSVCWAFLLPPENLPASKNFFRNFQKSGENRVFQVSY